MLHCNYIYCTYTAVAELRTGLLFGMPYPFHLFAKLFVRDLEQRFECPFMIGEKRVLGRVHLFRASTLPAMAVGKVCFRVVWREWPKLCTEVA